MNRSGQVQDRHTDGAEVEDPVGFHASCEDIQDDDPDRLIHAEVAMAFDVQSKTSTDDSASEMIASATAADDEMALLAKLQQANRMLEADSRSLHSLSPRPQHKIIQSSDGEAGKHVKLSRQSSLSSVISSASACSNGSNLPYDDGNQDNLWAIWGNIVTDWDNLFKRKLSHIKELVRKGIPNPFRGIVWQLLCNVNDCQDKERYADYLKMTSPFEKTISRDITRTFPGHDLFKEKDGIGQESLFNVMKAYSLHDREVGYCQGSSFIVGLLLMHMPEEEAFAVLIRIMNAFNLRELFKPSMAELGLCMFQLEALIQDLLPELHSHFQMHGVATSMFASSWFLALFTTILPIPLACRVFDVFLSEGMEVIFRVGIAMLQLNMDDILSLDMEETVKFLQKDLSLKVESDPDILLHTAFQVKYNARRLRKLEKEYNALKTKEQEEQIELRRLRTENKLLQQRINNLEKETEALADRLIHDQVKCAQQEEEICVLKRQVLNIDKKNTKEGRNGTSSTGSESPVLSAAKAPRPSILWQTQSGPKDKDTRIEQLQRELDETNAALVVLHNKVTQLENESYQSQQQRDVNLELRILQEDLIACKLREAEANMAIKELQHQVFEMEKHWQKFRERNRQSCDEKSLSSSGGLKVQQLNESLMAGQIREAVLLSEMTDLKQKLVHLEQQDSRAKLIAVADDLNHTNELRLCRSQEEVSSLKKSLSEKENECSEIRGQLDSIKAKQRDDVMVGRLREVEQSQLVTELRRKIAELEVQNTDLAARIDQQSGHYSDSANGEGFPVQSSLANKPSVSKVYLRYGGQTSFTTPRGSIVRTKPTAAVTANALRIPEPDVDADRTPTNDSFNISAFVDENQRTVKSRPLSFGNHPST